MDKIFTWPNIISLSRLLLAWPIAYSVYHNQLIITGILGFIAIISDFFDGYLSRKLNQASQVGKVIDPIVDGILVVSVMIALLLKEKLPLWYLELIVIRYSILFFLLLHYYLKYQDIPASIPSGKWSMCGIAITIILSLLETQAPLLFTMSLYLSALLLVYSFLNYHYHYLTPPQKP